MVDNSEDGDSPEDADRPEEGTAAEDTDTPEEGNPEDADESASNEVFRALSAEQRRLVLYYLRDRESTSVDELSTVVAGWLEAREDGAEVVTPDDRNRVRVKLHHVHLPVLDGAGFVRYDAESGTVALDSVPPLLDELLDSALAQERFAYGTHSSAGTDDEREEP